MTEERPDTYSETESNASSAGKKIKRKRRNQSASSSCDRDADVTAEPMAEGGEIPSGSLSKSKRGRSSRRSDDGGGGEGSSSLGGGGGSDRDDSAALNNSDRRDSYANRGRQDSGSSSRRSVLEQLQADQEASSIHDGGRGNWMRKSRLVAGQIVEEPKVQLFIIVLIIINSIIMGIGTFDFVTDDPEADEAFEKTDRVFLVIFTLELVLQLHYRRFAFFSDAWLIFDFAIVVSSWSLESLQVVRAFRIFRAFRLVTRIGPLRELVMAIGAVMPRMYAIAMLLFLIFYIFAVLFTELFSELDLSDNYFGSLDVSLFTCMEMMTLEWAELTREVMQFKSWAWAPLLAFISVTGFIVFNLIVAVVCDAVAVVDREANAEKFPERLTDKQHLEEAQERIWELTETVEILMMRQERLLSVADMLAKEVRAAVASPHAAAASAPNNPAPALKSAMKNSSRNSHPPKHIAHFNNNNEGDDEQKPTMSLDNEEKKSEGRSQPADKGNDDAKAGRPLRNDDDTPRVWTGSVDGEGVQARSAIPSGDDSVEVQLEPSADEVDDDNDDNDDGEFQKIDILSSDLEKDVQHAIDRITLGRTDRSTSPPGVDERSNRRITSKPAKGANIEQVRTGTVNDRIKQIESSPSPYLNSIQ